MKNIFKLGSVFMAIALVVSTLLFTGVLASADQVVASWATDGGVNYTYLYNGTEYINVYGGKTAADGTSWKTFANTVKPSIAVDEYMVYEISGSFEGAEAANVSLNNTGYDNVNGNAVVESCSATAIKIRMDGPFATVNGDDPGLNLTITSVTAAAASVQTETDVTVTVYKKGGSSETTATAAETGAEPTATAAATEAEPTATVTEAEPTATEPVAAVDWQLIYDGSFSGDVSFEASGLAPIPGDDWNNAMAAEIATYGVSEKYKIVSDAAFSGDGYACWGIYEPVNENQWWGDAFDGATYPYIIDIASTGLSIDDSYIFGMVGEGTCSVSADTFQVYAYREAGTEPTEPTATATETGTEATETGAEPTATATATEPSETEPSVTEPSETEPSVTEPSETEPSETEPSATEPSETEPSVTEPSETEPSVTEPSATETEPSEPVSLVETVLVENNVGGTKTLKPEKTDAWFLVVDEIKDDIAKNGPIDPDKGEYYQIIVTGSVDNGEADFHLGEGKDWNEYWGESGSITTEPSTVVATIPVAIPAEGIGDVYLADSGEAGHTLTWTYAKVSVFRVGEPTEPSEEPTEAEPTATATGTTEKLGDANNDGEINMKDVLTLRKFIAGLEVEINEAAADANADGEINMKDVLLLRKFIAGLIDAI